MCSGVFKCFNWFIFSIYTHSVFIVTLSYCLCSFEFNQHSSKATHLLSPFLPGQWLVCTTEMTKNNEGPECTQFGTQLCFHRWHQLLLVSTAGQRSSGFRTHRENEGQMLFSLVESLPFSLGQNTALMGWATWCFCTVASLCGAQTTNRQSWLVLFSQKGQKGHFRERHWWCSLVVNVKNPSFFPV